MTLRELLTSVRGNPYSTSTSIPAVKVREGAWRQIEVDSLPINQVYASIYRGVARQVATGRWSQLITVQLYAKPNNKGLRQEEILDTLFGFLTRQGDIHNVSTPYQPPIRSVDEDEFVNRLQSARFTELRLASPCIPPFESFEKPEHMQATINYLLDYKQF